LNKIKFILFFFGLVTFPNVHQGQGGINEIALNKLTTQKIFNILKCDILDTSNYWTYYSEEPNYLTIDHLEIFNHRTFQSTENRCFRTQWNYVDKKSNYINITDGIYLCKEPPSGGETRLLKLLIQKIGNKYFIEIFETNQKLADKFEIVRIEFKNLNVKEKAYKLYLNRIHL